MADKKKQSKHQPAKKQGDKFTRYLVIGMIALIVLAGVGAALAKSHSNSHAPVPASVTKADGYGISLNPTAKVKVDMYEDFRCPNCKNFEGINGTYVNSLVRAGKINAVYHPMSFIGPDSALAAAASACAADQNKFLEMHMGLFGNQPDTSKTPETTAYWNKPLLIALGAGIGITGDSFAKCINSDKYIPWTNNIASDAAAKNINGTPTVIVNGKTLPLATDYDAKAFEKVFTDLGIK